MRYSQSIVIATSIAVTLLFTSKAIDPFTLPKLLLLLLGTALLIPIAIWKLLDGIKTYGPGFRLFLIGLGSFLIITLISALTSLNWVNGIWGEYGRSNGFLNYLGLVILSLTAFLVFENPRPVLLTLSAVAFVANSYGVMQHNNADFIRWNNPFNPVITTFGNPNFAAAFAGMSAGTYIYLLLSEKERLLKYFALMGLGTSLAVVLYSNVTQSLFTFVVSVSLPILLWVYRKSKPLFLATSIAGVILGLLSILGVFRIGPLSEILGKSTFVYRTDYWLAGWKMMLNHPWLGVGADQYGSYFQEYRTLEQINRVNAAVMANNAHNVFIQIGATIGVFGLVLFLIFSVSPLVSAIRIWRTRSANEQNILAAGISIFLAYLVQATVSIDHIGLSIWGWLLGAVCLRQTMGQEGKKTASTSISAKYSRFAIASSVVVALAISPLLVQKIAFDIRMNNAVGKLWPSDAGQGPTDPNERQLATATILDTYGKNNYDPQYTLVVAKTFRNWNEKDLALKFAQEVLAKEPRSFDAWNLIASVYENSNEIKEALAYRLKSISLDPNNYELKLLISQDYFLINDFKASQEYLSQVLRDAPKSSSLYQSALSLAGKLQEKKS